MRKRKLIVTKLHRKIFHQKDKLAGGPPCKIQNWTREELQQMDQQTRNEMM